MYSKGLDFGKRGLKGKQESNSWKKLLREDRAGASRKREEGTTFGKETSNYGKGQSKRKNKNC